MTKKEKERVSLRESISLIYGEKPNKLDKKYENIPDMKHSEGCDYCHNFFNEGENSSLIKESLYLNSHKIADVDVCIDLDRLVLRSDNILSYSIRIEYCPMCGKKLEYDDRIKITNKDFSYDDPKFLMSLDLSVRPHNCLSRAGILSINDFCTLTAESLAEVRNLGRHSYVEIAYALREHGVIIADILKVAAMYKSSMKTIV